MSDRETVSRGLDLMFAAEIAALFALIPVLGVVAAIASLVMGIMGLVKCAKVNTGYLTTLFAHVVGMACAIVPLNPITGLVSTVCAFISAYFVCTATDEVIVAEGLYQSQRLKGSTVWKLHLGCDLALLACTLLAYSPLLNILAGIGAIGVLIATLAADILYVVFLYRSSKLLA